MSRDIKSQHAEFSSSFLSSPGQFPKSKTLDFRRPFKTINFSAFLLLYRHWTLRGRQLLWGHSVGAGNSRIKIKAPTRGRLPPVFQTHCWGTALLYPSPTRAGILPNQGSKTQGDGVSPMNSRGEGSHSEVFRAWSAVFLAWNHPCWLPQWPNSLDNCGCPILFSPRLRPPPKSLSWVDHN